ncbi:MAG: TonB-dependent receptor [Ketobacter sp.]|nr:TonB-dependent receptor [Ketobacter sp.]
MVAGLTGLASSAVHAQMVNHTGLEALFNEPVTVSATGKPQRVSEVPVAMQIITAEEIRRSGARDLPQLLRRAVGVEVVRNFIGNADVNIRGYNQAFSNRTLVLINGRQVYLDNFGTTIWQSLPVQLAEIKQVDIVRGPNTSLYGFNAASGVINIVTFNPLFDDVNMVELRGGTQQYQEVSGVKTFQSGDDLAFRLSGGAAQTDGFERDSMSPVPARDEALEKVAFNLDAMYRATDSTTMRAEAGYNNQTSDIVIPYLVQLDTQHIVRHYKLDVNHDTQDWGVWNLRYYLNEMDLATDSMRFGRTIVPSHENRLQVVQLSNLFSPADNHTVRLGGEYRHNELNQISFSPFSMDIYSANAMWDWKLNPKLSWTTAARVDHWRTQRDGGIILTDTALGVTAAQGKRSEEEFSFNSGLLYQATPDASYRFSVARGIRVPSLVELSQNIVAPGLFEAYGNPLLDTEKNTTVELGYTRQFNGPVDEFGATLFYQHLDDVIERTVRPIGGLGGTLADFTFENVGDSESHGVEMYLAGKMLEDGALSWRANYTFSLVHDDPDGLPAHFLDYEGTQPRHQFSLLGSYTNGPWELDADAHFTSSRDYRASAGDSFFPRRMADVSSYVTLNARLGYHFTEQTQLSLDGYNLLDEHTERPFFGRSNPAQLNTLGGNELGRAALLTLRHRF